MPRRTLQDALSHRTGLSGHFGAMRWARQTESLRDAVRKLRHLPLAYPPRSTWDYCNHMYKAVSHALEQRTGVDLGSFLQRRIWAPLRMDHTYFSIADVEISPAKKPRLARGYSWLPDSESYTPEPYMNYSPTTGIGAIVSNFLDYARGCALSSINPRRPYSTAWFSPGASSPPMGISTRRAHTICMLLAGGWTTTPVNSSTGTAAAGPGSGLWLGLSRKGSLSLSS